MSQADTGECVSGSAVSVEEEVVFSLVFGLRSAGGEVLAQIRVTLWRERHDRLR